MIYHSHPAQGSRRTSFLFKMSAFMLAFLLLAQPLSVVFAQVAEGSDSDTSSEGSSESSHDSDSSGTEEITGGQEEDTGITEEEEQIDESVDQDTDDTDSDSDIEEEEEESSSMSMMSSTPGTTTIPPSLDPQDIKKATPEVDKVSGALSYAYPIDLPPGRSNVTPDIKLSYNSQNLADQSEAGYGWNVNIPYITRTNKHGSEELYTGNYQDFSSSLFGDLIQTTSASMPDPDEGDYSQKVDSGNFLTYVYASNVWTVTDKNGTIYTYGATAAERQDDPSNSAQIYKWMLTEIRDTNDNFISYTYYKDAGQIYPDTVTYTGNGVTSGVFVVTFNREAQTNAPTSNAMGFLMETNYRFDDITVSINGTDVKEYDLNYTTGQNGVRNLLESVDATDLNLSLTLTTSFDYTTNRGISTSALGFASTVSVDSNIKIHGCSIGSMSSMQCGARFADINGDGLMDYVAAAADLSSYGGGSYTYTERSRIYFNTGTDFTNSGWIMPTRTMGLSFTGTPTTRLTFFDDFDSVPVDNNLSLVDVNNDGLADLIWQDSTVGGGVAACYHYTAWKVYLNTGSGWTYSSPWSGTPYVTASSCNLDLSYVQFADISGDGFPDAYVDGAYVGYHLYLNDQNGGWNEMTTSWNIDISAGTPDWMPYMGKGTTLLDYGYSRFVDINKDGLLDIVVSLRSIYDQSGTLLPHLTPTNMGEWHYVFMNTGHNWEYTPSISSFPANTLTFTNVQLAYPSSHASHVVFAAPDEFNLSPYYARAYVNNFFDFTADGLPDLMDVDSGTAYVYDSQNNLSWSSDGTFSSAWNAHSVPVLVQSVGSVGASGNPVLDLDGDSVLDYLDGSTEHINANITADLLTTITAPAGGSITVAYKNATQYFDGSSNPLNPELGNPLDVVESITVNDPVTSSSHATTYEYAGGKYYTANMPDKKFAGFHSITETDPAGNVTTTYYHQGDGNDSTTYESNDHYAKIGMPYRIEKFDNSNNLYTREIIGWDAYNLGTGHDFLKKASDVSMQYDGTGSHDDIATEYTYDNSHGSLLTQTEWGKVTAVTAGTFSDTGSDKRVTTYEYATGGTNGAIAMKHMTLADGSSVKLKENKYYYDTLSYGSIGDGNQTKVESWKVSSTYINSQKGYNAYGLVTSSTDPRGKVTGYSYDAYDLYPTTVTDALTNATGYTYDYQSGKVLTKTDPNSNVWSATYDGFGRPLTETIPDPAGGSPVTKTTYAYTDTPSAVSVHQVDYLDGSTTADTYSYFDGLGRVLQKRKEAESTNTYNVVDSAYNSIGKLDKQSLPYTSSGSSKTSATGTTTLYSNYTYDALGRVLTDQNNVGTTTTVYEGFKTTVTDPRTKVKNYYNDAYGNLIQVDEHNSASTYTTLYNWDLVGNLTGITDSLSNIRAFTYDGLGRRLTAEDLHASGDGTFGTWTYDYDDAGNMTQSISPEAKTVNYTYDDVNRQLTENYTGAGGTEITYVYDTGTNGIGHLYSVTMTGGANTVYTYNKGGATASEAKTINATTYTTSYTYDRQGNTLVITYPDSSQVRYTYNSAGLLNQIERKESGGSYTDVVSDIDYSPVNTPTVITYANTVATTNTYDPTELYRLTKKRSSTYTPPPFNNNPVITLTGAALIDKNVGDTWTDPGYSASDVEDGTLTGSVSVTGSVNTSVAGVYQLVYSVVDSASAPAPLMIRTVVVHTVTSPSLLVKTLVVGGGGGGGSSYNAQGSGGGGGGGYQYNASFSVSATSYSITVGAGGAGGSGNTSNDPGANGGNSIFSSITAYGGGGGAGGLNTNGLNGGNGGGGAPNTGTPGTGSQSYNGGNPYSGNPWGGGGGGGSAAVGGNASLNYGGAGGNGAANSITGSSVTYAGGGGGSIYSGGIDGGVGGTGGGGKGAKSTTAGVAGAVNTGGGGGASNGYTGAGGNGGSGIVIMAYHTDGSDGVDPSSTGGSVTTSGGYTIHTFTSSGTFTVAAYTPPTNNNPTITLTGAGLINKNVGDTWTDPGFSASDTEDGTITGSVTVTGTVNTAVAGTYQLVYAVVDSGGLSAARQIRTVVVNTVTSYVDLQNTDYTYDENGNITQIVDSSDTDGSKTVNYVYDDLNRMTSATATSVAAGQSTYTHTYAYSSIGNISSGPVGTYVYNGSSGSNWANPHAATSINSVTNTYDKDGNNLTDGTLTNTWNYKDQLTGTTDGVFTRTYLYDHEGNRASSADGVTTTVYPNKFYTYDGTTKTKDIYMGNTLVATVTKVSSTVTPYYVHADTVLGSNVVSDATGAQNQLLDYFPFGGVRINQQATAFDEQKQFGGHIFDADSGLNYLGARYLNSGVGRFISEDRMFWSVGSDANQLTNPQTQNSYSYAGNNPIIKTDPNGKCFWDGCILEVAALYAAAPVIIAGLEIAGAGIAAALAAHDLGTIAGTAMSDAPASYKNGVYDSIAGSWGAGLSVASQLSSSVVGEARTATRSTLQANKAAGAAFESKTGGALMKTQANVAPQITLETQSGIRTRIDFMTKNMSGQFCLFECKSSATAPLTKNQSRAFPEIQQSGATIVGKGKEGFPGGMSIPATKVNVVRPSR